MSTEETTVETIAPNDVLVAVSDPKATTALAMGNELYWAGVRASQAEEAYEKACDTPGFDDGRRRRLRDARAEAANTVMWLSQRFEELMAHVDDATYEVVEQTVWRDRAAEYARNREINERKRAR